jgi:heat shock protein HslJ
LDQRLLFRLSSLLLVTGLTACAGSGEQFAGPTPPATEDGSAGAGATAASASQLGGSWRLVRLEKGGQASVELAPSDRFAVEFSNGRALATADCNRCSGSYTAAAGTLTVGPLACTRAFCSSAPLDSDFTALLGGAERWSVAAGQLELRAPNGTLRLRR